MKQFKTLVALVLALMLTMSIMSVAFASDTSNLGAPYDGDTHSDTTFNGVADNSISVGGLQAGDQVKFYRVLDYDQDARGTLGTDTNAHGWKVVAPFNTGTGAVTAADLQAILTTGITADMAGRIAKNATGTPTHTATVADGSTVATKTAPGAGLYVAIVVPANAGFTYNPIFVASDYYTTTGGDQSSTWTAVTTPLSYSDRAMAKKSEITVTKTAAEASEASNETNGAKAVGVGDTINYTITTTIPEFADNYLSPLFVVTDTLSAGLTLVKNISVTGMDASTYDITYPDSGADFKITFKPASLLELTAATNITITYSATVTENAITNVNEEDNTVTLEYSHNPDVDQEGEGKKVGDKTHHYTFTIDGNVWGTSERLTTEVVKVGLDKDGNEITQTTTLSNGKTIGALEGAEFKLYTDASCNTEYNKGAYASATATTAGNKIVSNADGILKLNGASATGIPGLDAGTYYLKEEKAPDGYIKQQTAIMIEIIPTFYDPVTWTESGIEITSDDILDSYIVKIDDTQTASYKVHYEMNAENTLPINDVAKEDSNNMMTDVNMTIGNTGPITTVAADTQDGDDDGKIKNTRGVELPSTGGIGTTIFYVAGIVLVLGAAAIIIARRKAEQQ